MRKIMVTLALSFAFLLSQGVGATGALAATCVTALGIDGGCTCGAAGFCHTEFGDFSCAPNEAGVFICG